MSFETIKIVRKLPIVNGFVQIPNNLEEDKTAVSKEELLGKDGDTSKPIDGVKLSRLTVGTGGPSTAGGRYGNQEFIEFDVADGNVDGQQANLNGDEVTIE